MLTLLERKSIVVETDIVVIRQIVKNQAAQLKFNLVNQTKIITAASEIARNTYKYGGGGECIVYLIEDGTTQGLKLVFEDKGPGISDIDQALQDGFTTGGGMGLGLSGSKRLVDKFDIQSAPNQGTCITLIKWKI